MNKNYMIYPLKNMRITQSYYGDASHRRHWDGVSDYSDYPIDDGGLNSTREAIYCPCDEMRVTAIRGLNNPNVTNTIWLVSTAPAVTPTFTDIVFMTLTHSTDQDLSRIKVGDIFKRGEVICYEGDDGASSFHVHIVAGRGYSDNWRENSQNKWVITGDTKRPEEVFFIDRNFTNEIWGGFLPWVTLPSDYVGIPVTRNLDVTQLEVKVTNLRARVSPSLSAESVGYISPGIYNYSEKVENDNYLWFRIDNFYVAYQPEWIKLLEYSSSSPLEWVYTSVKKENRILSLNENDQLYIKRKSN